MHILVKYDGNYISELTLDLLHSCYNRIKLCLKAFNATKIPTTTNIIRAVRAHGTNVN